MGRPLTQGFWSREQIDQLINLRQGSLREGITHAWPDIATLIGRPVEHCRAKYHYEMAKRATPRRARIRIKDDSVQRIHPPTLRERLAERAVLRDASERRDLTATLCGDPPPGYSALDRRSGAA